MTARGRASYQGRIATFNLRSQRHLDRLYLSVVTGDIRAAREVRRATDLRVSVVMNRFSLVLVLAAVLAIGIMPSSSEAQISAQITIGTPPPVPPVVVVPAPRVGWVASRILGMEAWSVRMARRPLGP